MMISYSKAEEITSMVSHWHTMQVPTFVLVLSEGLYKKRLNLMRCVRTWTSLPLKKS